MLQRYTLKKSGDGWVLRNQIGELIRNFKTKAEALTGGTLEGIVSEGTVRIHRDDGQFQEERTFPRAKDPRRSPG